MTGKMTPICWIAMVLLVIGGINWGLVGLFELDLVAAIFGEMTVITKVIYVIVAIAAIYTLVGAIACCGRSTKQKPGD